MGTEVLNLKLETVLRAALGSLEGHVLEEMRGSVGLVGLGAASCVDPNTDGGGSGREVSVSVATVKPFERSRNLCERAGGVRCRETSQSTL